LEGVPSTAVAFFAGGHIEHYPAADAVLVEDNPR
jgi:hypothetical protein